MISSSMPTLKLSEVFYTNRVNYSKSLSWDYMNYLDTGNITKGEIHNIELINVNETKIPSRARRIAQENDIIFSLVRPNQCHYGLIKNPVKNLVVSTGFIVLTPKTNQISSNYIYHYLTQNHIVEKLHKIAEDNASTYPSLRPSDIESLELNLPDILTQKKIANILDSLLEKMALNNKINKTLEEMAQVIFKSWFVDFEFPDENREPYKSSGGEMIESELGMIPKGWKVSILNDVINIIDNRGKTPPQEPNKTIYPIIDVKALSGYTRVIDYSDCTKYVSKETYNNWFRNGHPIHGDILISTVGSLAELKIFMGSTGCIAQNVVALRAKTISNLYLFELLKKNKNDLVSYDIGSVQPSIKVTHIIKHKILIPNFIVMDQFHQLMNEITNEVFVRHNENVLLTSMRDTILPKLMSGEIRIPLEEV